MSPAMSALLAEVENALTYLSTPQAAAVRKRLGEQADNLRQWDHTRLELVAGAYIARLGYSPQYEPELGTPEIGSRTPDWIFDLPAGGAVFFGDVYTFHMADETEREQDRQLEERGLFSGLLPNSEDRLYPALRKKAVRYGEVAEFRSLPFVVFVFGCFNAFLHPMEVRYCLSGRDGLFTLYPQLSGIYHFESIRSPEHGPVYDFRFYASPCAARPIGLPSGVIPYPIPRQETAPASPVADPETH